MSAASRRPTPLPGAPDGVVLYDGVCILCSRALRFVAARDPGLRFRFAQVQTGTGRRLALELGIDPDAPDTNALILDGTAWFRSDAALQILSRLPGWSWTALLLHIPRPLRDWIYDRVARNRYRLFGRTETCLMPSPELRRHLLQEPHAPSGTPSDAAPTAQ